MSPASPGATATNASPMPAAPDQATPRLPLALRVFGLIPLALCSLLGGLVGMLAYAASGDYRRKVNDNLRIAGYGPGRVRRRAIIEAGRMVVECPYVWSHKPRAISRLVLATDLEPIERAEARGKGVLILMPHLGSFEAAARFYAARRPITVLFKPPKIEFVRRWLIAARAAEGIQAVPPTVGGLRTMLRTLRRGDIVGLLPDQVPTAGDGVWAPFFGQPAYTMTLPERLVEMTDCTVGRPAWPISVMPSCLTRLPTRRRPDVVPAPPARPDSEYACVKKWPALACGSCGRFRVCLWCCCVICPGRLPG